MNVETYLKNGQYTIELEPEYPKDEVFLNSFFNSPDEPTIQKHQPEKSNKVVLTISKGM